MGLIIVIYKFYPITHFNYLTGNNFKLNNPFLLLKYLKAFILLEYRVMGVIIFLLFLCTPSYVIAQEATGLPRIDRYTPQMYRAHNQNWAAAQDSLGIMYFGNTSGVLVYNGRKWELISTPKKTAVRGLVRGRDGRIYVGGQSEFGYLAADTSGELKYVSLTGQLTNRQKDFSDIWITLATRKGVYFMSSERLFRYDYADHSIHSWDPKTHFYYIYDWQSRLYLQETGVGLLTLKNDSLHLVNDSKIAKQATINNMLPYSSGKALVVTGNSGFYQFNGTTFTPFVFPDEKLIRSDDPYVAINLPDSTYMIGTLKDGIFQLDHNGQLLNLYNRSNGLQNNVVLNLYMDREQDIWAEHENGISKINWNSNTGYFTASVYGFMGPVLAINRFKKDMYLGTGLGLYHLVRLRGHLNTNGYDFEPVNENIHQVWSLLTTSNHMFIAAGRGTYIMDGKGKMRQITPEESFSLYRPGAQSDTVYVGLEKGVMLVRKMKEGWKRSGKIPGLVDEIRSMYESKDHSLWMATDYRGLFRARRHKNGNWAISHFDTTNGLPEGTLRLYNIGGRMMISSVNGFYIPADTGEMHFKRINPFTGKRGANLKGIENYVSDSHGNAWMVSQDSVSHILLKNNRLIYQPGPYKHFRDYGIESVYIQNSKVTWFGANSLLIRYTFPSKKQRTDFFRVLLTSIKTPGRKTVNTTYKPAGSNVSNKGYYLGRYHSSHGSFRFNFTSTTFRDERKTRYRYRLDGFDNKWSGWSAEDYKEYSNLPAGDYIFKVEAINTKGIISRPADVAFDIMAPWYKSYWAIIGYILLFVGFSYGAGKIRVQYLEKKNRDLKKLIDSHTRRVKDQNQELQRKNKALSELNQLRSEFLNMASHDLKNPLIGIEGMSRILIEDMEEGSKTKDQLLSENLEILRLIHGSSRYMSDILSNLLDTTALESGSVSISVKQTDLVSLTKAVIDEMKETARNKGIKLILKSPDTAVATCDPNRTRQIIQNIIVNAVKYSKKDSEVDILITNKTIRLKKGSQISVRDHGPGFTDEDLEKVFGKFQRLSAKPTEGESSTGLGLYISKSFVDLQNGKIWVENHKEEGAVVYLELPGV